MSSETMPTDKGFIGQAKHSSTGLQYLNARYEARKLTAS